MNTKPTKKTTKRWKRRLRKFIILLIVLLVLAAVAWYAYATLKAEYTVTYDAYTASIGTISNSLSFSGSLELIDSATYTSTSATTVRTVYVEVGDDVEDGDKLIRLADGTTIEAEFDGRVNALNVEEGDEVSAGESLIQVADFTNMRISFRVDEYDIADVSVGLACTVTATATERTFESEIATINYISASSGSVAYYTATAEVEVDDGIYPGMQVTVTIPQEEANDVVILKEDALSFDSDNSAYVWMYNDDGELEQVSVEIGVSNGNYVEITSGLEDGDVVYAESETTTTSGLSSILSSVLGSQQVNGGGGGMDMSNFDMSDFSSDSMPDMTSGGGGMGGGGMGGGGQ